MGELQASSAEVLAELRYDLPATYAFHRLGPTPMRNYVHHVTFVSVVCDAPTTMFTGTLWLQLEQRLFMHAQAKVQRYTGGPLAVCGLKTTLINSHK